VFSQAKYKHNEWSNALVSYAIDILIAFDKTSIWKARLAKWRTQLSEDTVQDKKQVFLLIIRRKNIEQADQALASGNAELTQTQKIYSEKASQYNKLNTDYISTVVSESNRMFAAGQSVGCSVGNEVRFMVATNWNQVFPCVNSLTKLSKPYSANAFNSYCPGKSSSSYLGKYKLFLLGLREEDKEAVKAASNANWFNIVSE